MPVFARFPIKPIAARSSPDPSPTGLPRFRGRQAGVQRFDEKDFTFSADGYDKDKRIGYVIGDWNNLGTRAYRTWLTQSIEEIASGRLAVTSEGEEHRLREHIDSVAESLTERRQLSGQQKAQLAGIRKIEPLQARARAYLTLFTNLDELKLSLAEIERAEKMGEAHQMHLAIISVFDQRFEINGVPPELQKKFEDIEGEAAMRTFADPGARWEWISKQREPLVVEMDRQRLGNLARAVREYIAWARRNGIQ